MRAVERGLFGFGYVASIVVLSRFVAVVRERRVRWLAVHHLGVAAIIAAWVSRREPSAAAVNGLWLVASSVWYLVGGRSHAAATPADGTAAAASGPEPGRR